jgi:hypothetical protein
MKDIEHRTTKIRSPRTNGFVERMNRTMLDECFACRDARPGTSKLMNPARSGYLHPLLQSRAHSSRLSPQGPHAGSGLDGSARRHRYPRHHPATGGRRAATNGCLTTSPRPGLSEQYEACTYRSRGRHCKKGLKRGSGRTSRWPPAAIPVAQQREDYDRLVAFLQSCARPCRIADLDSQDGRVLPNVRNVVV